MSRPPNGRSYSALVDPGAKNSTLPSIHLDDTMTTPQPDQHQPHHHHGIMQETEAELTDDELIEYEKGILTWDKAKSWRFWIRKEWIWWYIVLIILVVLVALMAFFHHSIIDWLTPFTKRLQNLKAGFVIPAAIIFALSFPPLFGNEIVMILVGVVWGLGKGFAIVTVGTILGEVANYVVFKYWCRRRAERLTRKSLNYACLSRVIAEGGFIMATIVRLSVIPTHFTTMVFAVCGLKFYHFFVALILGLPKQLITVYVGVVLAKQNASTNSHVVSDCVFAATVVISLFALWFIYRRMTAVRKQVLLEMREDLRGKGVATSDPLVDGAVLQEDENRHQGFEPRNAV
ncbi:hypothetical protein BCR39DRAFT_542633 [Naematelia encephala]|uniref:Golgi apparatus membrane protein TVP38 n=1 Tax=Naematelia encephala TaxID=71784 RepID=A0A1Y2AVJ4_9TREE|nr:hypothetical protein BCR39DRAFT_542633 [Naematelia encephala]